MKRFLKVVIPALVLLVFQVAIYAQGTGSISGAVTDPNGAVIAGASVIISGGAGQKFSVVTAESGNYRVPAIENGVYTVTISASGFKTSSIKNVKVDVATPVTVDAKLEIGSVGEVVEVTSGGEVLQTQTATVGATIQSRQILGTPIASRDALDIVGTLPGTATVGRPRTSTINGLPKGSLSITIDGVDVQVNDSRSSDGFFTYVRPRVDAIEEVTVSTANPGAESSGDGAIQIKFVTKRGANDYHVGAFWQTRNDAFNANYWYLNRNPVGLDKNGKSVRQKMRLNQYGFNGSGPIPFLKFGEGGGIFDSGKDKRFFFFNYEEFRQPQSLARTRKIISPEAQAGNYQYFATIPSSGLPTGCATTATTNQMLCSRNVFTIAAANAQLSTIDPTVAAVYSRIRTAIAGQTLVPIVNNPNVSDLNVLATNKELRTFLALRFDANITKKHSFEAVINRQMFGGQKDLLNGREETFPGFPSFNQISNRNSYAFAVRSTFGQNIVNEARYAIQEGGPTVFAGDSSPSVFGFMGGRSLGIFPSLTGTTVTAPNLVNGTSRSKNPVFDFTDSVNWVMGNHSLNFGGNYKLVRSQANNNNRYVPSVGFGLDSTDAAFSIFAATNCTVVPVPTTCTLPGASSAQLTDAKNLYAVLAGRVLSYTTTAYLNTTTGIYAENGSSIRKAEQKSYGAFIQDSWRISSSFTINYGVRWQPQTGFTALSNGNYTRLESYDQVYGLSGLNNIFKPGTLTGTAPRVVKVKIGEKVYPDDLNNFAPTIGVVWSPNFGEKGFLHALFGAPGKSVFRGGYSVAFVREGTALLESINGANPGGSLVLSRNLTISSSTGTPSFTVGTNLRDGNNPNLTAFEPLGAGTIIGQSPAFPIALTASNSTNAFNPNIKTGQVRSYSFGYQREIDKNTVVEVRYVGNKGTKLQRQYNLNEFNTIENGFATEFKLAQDNLYANIAAGRGNSFAYFGAGTNTSPLPIMVAYFNPTTTNNPGIAQGVASSGYTATNFANATLVASLSRLAPSIGTFSGSSFESNATRRANALANGLASNFFYVNPTTPGGSWTVDNTNETWYNSAVIEVRRRLSAGLRLNANYVFSKAMANAFTTDAGGGGGQPPTNRRPIGLDLARNVQISDLRHQFKVDATYDFPFGKGGQFFANANGIVNAFIGGWTLAPTLRWQSGSPITIGNVQLVGMTVKELQKAIKVRKEASLVFFLPDDIILNSQKAFNVDVTNTANGGYGTTYGTGGPTGKYLAPANSGNCISTFGGQCGFANLVVYGPMFFKLDASLSKKIKFGERLNIELRATALDVLNHPNFRVGGFSADTAGFGCCGSTFGQLGNGSAYQDTSTTNDPGGRVIDLMFRINW